jgi:phage-related protein
VQWICESPNGPFDLRNKQKFKRLEDNHYELKADQVRLLFFIEARRVMIVTQAFLKKSQHTPPREIARAKAIRDRYKQEQQP